VRRAVRPTVGDIGEEALIERVARLLGPPGPPVTVGIGDDCAVLDVGGRCVLFAHDTVVEGVHFLGPDEGASPLADARSVGWRLGACNISDVAAMGGRPVAATVSVACAADLRVSWLDAVYEGLRDIAARYGLAVCGGDVVRIDGPTTLSLAILGEVDGSPVLRSGAAAGEVLCVTGALGESRAALGGLPGPTDAVEAVIRRHLYPSPRVAEGQLLRSLGATAMMDLSDGLASDALKLAAASGVGVRIRLESLPVSDELVQALGSREAAVEAALVGGDDYELLVCLPPDRVGLATEGLRGHAGLTAIGVVTESAGGCSVELPHGRVTPLSDWSGWRHF